MSGASAGIALPGEPQALRAAARSLAGGAEELARLAAASRQVPPALQEGGWQGAASDAFARALNRRAVRLEASAARLRAAAGVLNELAAQLEHAGQQAVEAARLLEGAGELEAAGQGQQGAAAERLAAEGQRLRFRADGLLDGARQAARAAALKAAAELTALAAPGSPGGPGGPGGPGHRRPPAEILDEYQVLEDPEGIVMYPPWPYSMLVEQRPITRGEARLLDDIGLLGQKDFLDLRNAAYDTAEQRFPGQGAEDGHQDAFRHAYWNALMVQRFGLDWAARMGTAHERLPGNPADREAMDLYNNEVGRRIAEQHPDASPEELADLVEQAVRRGDMVVIDAGGELAYSDQVPAGVTGTAGDPPRDGQGAQPPEGTGSEWSHGYDPGSQPDASATASG